METKLAKREVKLPLVKNLLSKICLNTFPNYSLKAVCKIHALKILGFGSYYYSSVIRITTTTGFSLKRKFRKKYICL